LIGQPTQSEVVIGPHAPGFAVLRSAEFFYRQAFHATEPHGFGDHAINAAEPVQDDLQG